MKNKTGPEIAEKAQAATVYLEMRDSNDWPLGIGSGFFVKPNLIATNYHVIAGAVSGTAKLVGKDTTYKVEGCIVTDMDNDLALLKVTAPGVNPLPLGDSDAVKVGEEVYVVGNPKELVGTVTKGIISSRRDVDAKECLQMDAPISPGSSGGPVLNTRGAVVGVSVALHQDMDAQNLNFAIPSKYLQKLLAQTRHDTPSWSPHTVSAEIHFLRGNVLRAQGLYEAAIEVYTQAIRLESNHASAYLFRGIAKSRLGDHFAAISDYDEVIWLKPDYALAYYNRGIEKEDLREYSGAISDYDRTIHLKPDYAEAYYNRGNARRKLGDHSAALSDYDEVIRLKPDYTDAYLFRGFAKANLREHFEAILDYDRAIRLKPDFADA